MKGDSEWWTSISRFRVAFALIWLFISFICSFISFNSSSSFAALKSAANLVGFAAWLGRGYRFWLVKLPSSSWPWFRFPLSSWRRFPSSFWLGLGIWTSFFKRRRVMSSWFCRARPCISCRSKAFCRANSWMLAVRACNCLFEALKCWSLVFPASMEKD